MKKSLLVFSLAGVGVLAASGLAVKSSAGVNAAGLEKNVDYAGSKALWANSTNASFTGGEMQASSASFNWVSKKMDTAKVKLTTNESLTLTRDADWKYEYITLSTTGESGIDAANGHTTAKNSVSFVWGWIPIAQVVEVDASGNTIAKSVGYEGSDINIEGLHSTDFATSMFRHTFDCKFEVSIEEQEVTEGVKFTFTVHGTDEWGAYGGYDAGITASFEYISTNKTLLGEKSISIGRTGSGTVDGDHKIGYTVEANDENISGNADNWEVSTGATFSKGQMHSATPGFNWVTKKDNISEFTLKTIENLGVDRAGDWRRDYLMISASGEGSYDFGYGNATAKNSLTLSYGMGVPTVQEVDGEGALNSLNLVTSGSGIVASCNIDDANVFDSLFVDQYTADRIINVKRTVGASNVTFDFTVSGKSLWGHDVVVTFSVVSTNMTLGGNVAIGFGHNTGHVYTAGEEVRIELNAKVAMQAAEGTVTGVDITGAADVEVGSTVQLGATVSGEGEYNHAVIWSSSNNNIATVDANGLVTGVADGEVTITAISAADNEIFDTVVINSVDPSFVNYGASANNWATLYNASVSEGKVVSSGTPSLSITNRFGGDATIKFVVDHTAEVGDDWGGMVLMFKGSANDMAATAWSFVGANEGNSASVASGDWLALSLTNGVADLFKCVNGTVTSIKSIGVPATLNGYDFWHIAKQKTEVTVKTTDTDNGVHVELSYLATGHADSVNTSLKSCSFDVNEKALWGNQSAAFVQVVSGSTVTNGYHNIRAKSQTSEHSKAEYHVSLFADAVAAIPSYTSVTPENYSALVAAYNAAKTAYDNLREEELVLVDEDDVNAMNALKNAIDNCDKVPFVEQAIELLDDLVAYTRENYEVQKALVEDAKAKYDSLGEEDKARVAAASVAKLEAAIDTLEEFEEHLGYANEAIELIDAIILPITHYGRAKHQIADAKAAFDLLDDFEKSLVTNAEKLEDAIGALAQYKAENQNPNYNFALDPVNFADTADSSGITMKDGSMIVNTTDRWASLYPTAKVGDGKEVQIDIDSGLSESGWGNFYFVFKSDKAMKHHEMGAWAQDGNYAVLLMGSDGFKVIECVNGVLPMSKDGAGNPIADWSKGTDLSDQLTDPLTQFDAYNIWEQYTTLKIKTVDNFEGGACTGYTTTFTLVGGNSYGTKTISYTSTNALAEGAGYVGLELYTGAPINRGNGSGFTVDGWYIEGITEYDGAAVKADMKAEQDAASVDALIAAIGEVTLDSKSAIEAARTAYNELDDLAKSKVTGLSTLEAAEATLVSLEEAAAAAELAQAKADAKDELDDAYAALDLTKYSEENKVALLDAVSAGKTAIDAATDKAGVASALRSAKAALSEIPEMEPTPEPSPEENKGCGGSIVAASAIVTGLALAGVTLVASKKKEN